MSNDLIDPTWPVVGRTGNGMLLLADPRILVVPDEGAIDDEAAARRTIDRQHAYWKAHDLAGATVVLMDRIAHQTRAHGACTRPRCRGSQDEPKSAFRTSAPGRRHPSARAVDCPRIP
jgi:hypothetical protein